MTQVKRHEFQSFLDCYPRPLESDVVMFCEPPARQWNDFKLGDWPDSVVCQYTIEPEPIYFISEKTVPGYEMLTRGTFISSGDEKRLWGEKA